MPAGDPEDALDQAMVQYWQALSMSVRNLTQRIEHDVREASRLHGQEAQRRRQQTEQLRARLSSWRSEHQAQINEGFARTLHATVLAPDNVDLADPTHPVFRPGRQSLFTDESLLKCWMVADQITDPAFFRERTLAKQIIENEYGARNPGQPIDQAVEQLTDRIVVETVDPADADFRATMRAFERAGATVTAEPVDPDMAAAFRRAHEGQSFCVRSELHGSWNGYDRERLTTVVLSAPIADETARYMFLKDSSLSETSHADGTATYDEPATVDETLTRDASETVDAAPIVHAEAPETSGRDNPARPAGSATMEGEPVVEGRRRSDGRVPEAWYGPDPFGALSPAQEAAAVHEDVTHRASAMTSDVDAIADFAKGRSK